VIKYDADFLRQFQEVRSDPYEEAVTKIPKKK